MRPIRELLAPATAAASLALGACGGGDDGLPVDEYRAQLDGACERLTRELALLPQVVADEDLEIEAAAELADEAGAEFNDDVQALEPPEQLADAHEELLAAIETPPPTEADQATVRERALQFAELYEAVGAEGCTEGQRRAAKQVAATDGG